MPDLDEDELKATRRLNGAERYDVMNFACEQTREDGISNCTK